MDNQRRKKAIRKCNTEYRNGTPVSEIQQMLGISKTTVYRWLKERTYCSTDHHIPRTVLLEQEHQRQMIEIYQKTELGLSSPFEQKVKAITALNGTYSLNLLCSTLGVAKATYYRAIEKHHQTTFDIKREEMTPVIGQLFDESKQTIGAVKITALLHEQGYKISPKLVADIMHRNGWFSIRSGAKKLYYQNRERMENCLQQEFSVSRPDEVWVSDITEIKIKGFKYFICVVLDLFARKIIAFHISSKNSTQLVNRTFKEAYQSRNPRKPLMLHTDRGCNYTSQAFNRSLRVLEVSHSYSEPARPYNNSVCEAFFKTLKQEELYRHEYRSAAEMKKSVSDYIVRYNSKRPHAYLHNQTPDHTEEKHYEKMGLCGS